MVSLAKIETWADRHHPKWIDILRIVLGVILFSKGIIFINDRQIIVEMLMGSKIEFISFMIAHYVILIHIVGGITIAIGLLTRLSVLLQLPILIGAVIFVNLPKGFFALNSELGFSLLVLFMLLFYLFYGSGPLSVDHYIATHKDR